MRQSDDQLIKCIQFAYCGVTAVNQSEAVTSVPVTLLPGESHREGPPPRQTIRYAILEEAAGPIAPISPRSFCSIEPDQKWKNALVSCIVCSCEGVSSAITLLALHNTLRAQYTYNKTTTITMVEEVVTKKVLNWPGIDHLKDHQKNI